LKSHNLKLHFLVYKHFKLTWIYSSINTQSGGQGRAWIILITLRKIEEVAENLMDLDGATSGIMGAWKWSSIHS